MGIVVYSWFLLCEGSGEKRALNNVIQPQTQHEVISAYLHFWLLRKCNTSEGYEHVAVHVSQMIWMILCRLIDQMELIKKSAIERLVCTAAVDQCDLVLAADCLDLSSKVIA